MNEDWTRRLDALMPLEGESVRLEPLATSHHTALCDVGLDDELWRWTTSVVRTRDDMTAYVANALELRAAHVAYPLAIVDRASGTVAGSTRFGNIDAANRRLEIGWTWLGRAWQRTALNTETKYLLMRAAFEHFDCMRVEFKTDVLNTTSRAALRRVGATEEGVLRRHMITATGRVRDTICFSIIADEWPAVSAALETRLAARPG